MIQTTKAFNDPNRGDGCALNLFVVVLIRHKEVRERKKAIYV